MKRYTRMTSLAGAMAAGAMLMGCSSDDNLDRFEFPNFPSIAMAGADEDRRADADLTGDALAYQAALIYETTLNFRDYDAIERPLTDEPNGRTDCALDGYVHHDRFTAPYSGSFGEGPVDAEAVTAYGCTVADTEYNAAGERAVSARQRERAIAHVVDLEAEVAGDGRVRRAVGVQIGTRDVARNGDRHDAVARRRPGGGRWRGRARVGSYR